MEDALDARAEQLDAHDDDQHAHAQRAQVFHAAKAKGIAIRLVAVGQAHAGQGHDAAARVGEVIGRVGRGCHAACGQTHGKLDEGQQQVGRDARERPDGAPGLAAAGLGVAAMAADDFFAQARIEHGSRLAVLFFAGKRVFPDI